MDAQKLTTKGVRRLLTQLGIEKPTRGMVNLVAIKVGDKPRRGGVTIYWTMTYGNPVIAAAIERCCDVPKGEFIQAFAKALE